MTKYDNRYNNRDNFGNKYRKYYDNAAARSGSDGKILYPITTPWSSGGGLGDDGDRNEAAAHYVSMRWTIIYVISIL